MTFTPDKPYKTYDEMLEILRFRNLVIDDDQSAKRILSNHSYYAIVNGSKELCTVDNREDWFEDGTTIEFLHSAFIAQKSIHSILLKYIIYVEQSLKSKMGQLIASRYGVMHTLDVDLTSGTYLDRKNYVNSTGARFNTLKDLVKEINRFCQANKSATSSYYYLTEKNHLPPWILLKDLNFGCTIRWYKILKDGDKSEIVSQMLENKLRHSDTRLRAENQKALFVISMDLCREYRNIFAHGDKPYPGRITFSLPKKELLTLLPPRVLTDKEYNTGLGTNDLTALLFSLVLLLGDNFLIDNLIMELNAQIKFYTEFADELHLSKNIFQVIGAPSNIVQRMTTLAEERNIQ